MCERIRHDADVRGRAADAVQHEAADGAALDEQRLGQVVVKRRAHVHHALVRQVFLQNLNERRHATAPFRTLVGLLTRPAARAENRTNAAL
ncbi:hypothetical protein SDC9_96574 [bioreactor metagenome]|uniref:Uncharacterized protein n=1 Tax=bioreactor metagenome TaxID=1076179 RepID=A0A645A9M7_9ZZZZ